MRFDKNNLDTTINKTRTMVRRINIIIKFKVKDRVVVGWF